MTRGERVIAFIERYCLTPEGDKVGQPLKLEAFQKRFILDVYDNPSQTSRAYLSIARKNGKTALIAALVLAHVAGPEAILNSQIVSGARSRDQAGLVFKAARKMVELSPVLSKLIHVTPSKKELHGLTKNVEYRALSAEGGSNHGLSPVVAILDEVGQIKLPHDDFVEAIESSQGAYSNALLFAISTQAASDAALFSLWLDAPDDPHVIKHLYTADADCDLDDRSAWEAANPALGTFRSLPEMERAAKQANDLPSKENSFRWLYLNQRISAEEPFIYPALWKACGSEIADWRGKEVYGGLDLSSVSDLTSLVLAYQVEDVWNLKSWFWLPKDGMDEKSKKDGAHYREWAKAGYVEPTPGNSVSYDWVAERIFQLSQECTIKKIGFDAWNYRHLKPRLSAAGFRDDQLEGDAAIFKEFGQGYKEFSPALRVFEEAILNKKIAHGLNPVLNMCMMNAVVSTDSSGNRKIVKKKATGRIDGAVAATMAIKIADTYKQETPLFSYSFG